MASRSASIAANIRQRDCLTATATWRLTAPRMMGADMHDLRGPALPPDIGQLPVRYRMATGAFASASGRGVMHESRPGCMTWHVSPGRMSGTEHGAVALHVAPEAAAGGPIGLVRDGHEIALDASRGILDPLVDERELARRASEQHTAPPAPAGGYEALYAGHVLQADEGCDLGFLLDPATRRPRSRRLSGPVPC
jgi:hypothetical protein